MVIYLSRWNLFITAITSLLGAYLVTSKNFRQIHMTDRFTKVLKAYWFLSNNSVVFACVISIIYWTLLYREGVTETGLNNYLVHATNSILLIVDIFVIRHPHYISHFIYPMACGTLYVLFTIIYTVLGGIDRGGNNYVYPILDWNNKPRESMLVGGGCVALLGIFHIIICGLHKIRESMYGYMKKALRIEIKIHERTNFTDSDLWA